MFGRRSQGIIHETFSLLTGNDFFSSPEPKAQVSFSDKNLSVVVHVVVVVVVVVFVINFSHFQLLLQNH